MRIKLILTLLSLVTSTVSFTQEKHTLSGTISDAFGNETLIGVNVFVRETGTVVATNEYGFYSISLPKGEYHIVVSYIGYTALEESIILDSDIRKNFSMSADGEKLAEVIIDGQSTVTNIRKAEMSTNKLTIQQIKEMPAVLGEVDVLKSSFHYKKSGTGAASIIVFFT